MSYESEVIRLIEEYEEERGPVEEVVRHRMIVSAQDMDRLTNYVEKVNARKEENVNED
jgi:hypothetical protein